MKNLKLISSAVTFFICFVAFSQERTITGVVSDAYGEVFPGAGVYNTTSKKGTNADMDGKYSILAHKGDLITFSFIGRKTETKKVRRKNIINITLVEEHQELGEVIGTPITRSKSKSQDVTINNQSVSLTTSKDTIRDAKASPNVMQPQTQNTRVVICAPSRSSAIEPITVLDGKIIDSKKFSQLNPNDIKEIKILKGNEAKLIYGDKAVNGVIVITSKK